MTTFFTADTHFGHKNIIQHCRRPFSDVDNMTRLLVQNWNEVVTDDDTVYHLGDISFLNRAKTADIVTQLNGTIHLVRGNHDGAKGTFYEDLFESVSEFKTIKVDGQSIVLCHYALKVWNNSHHGAWNLHGHSHGNLEDDPHALQWDVGVDSNHYYPVSFETLQVIMANKTYKPVDHHGRD